MSAHRHSPTRCIAVDWSGAKSGAHRRIWLAEATAGEVVRLENGRTREVMAQHLVEEGTRDPQLIVGLDFAFSLPSWFLAERELRSAVELWDVVATDGERWLGECAPPFWGRPGKRRPDGAEPFRRADREVPAIGGIRPKSVFQVGGAGAVGTGSLRGMPLLRTLRSGGFAVWPFDAPRWPVVVEIYPRLLTGAVVKSSASRRAEYLDARSLDLSPAIRRAAERYEDAFDAVVSAIAMDAAMGRGGSLPPGRDALDLLEGRVWVPGIEAGETGMESGRFAD